MNLNIRLKKKLRPRELPAVYQKLFEFHGHQNWWPGETPFEIMVGAILTQNTAWINVEKAIVNLKQEGLLTPQKMDEADEKRLARAIQPSGFFNIKTRRLKNFLTYLRERYGYRIAPMKKQPLEKLRSELLAVNGIGPETADSILVYALEKPSFVIDAYTRRIFSRHGLMDASAGYEQWRRLFEQELPADTSLYNDFHAQIVLLAKTFCRARQADCRNCPLGHDVF